MRNAACHPAFSQFVGDEERLVVGHVAWCVALFVNVALHDGERVVSYRAVVCFGEYRTLRNKPRRRMVGLPTPGTVLFASFVSENLAMPCPRLSCSMSMAFAPLMRMQA